MEQAFRNAMRLYRNRRYELALKELKEIEQGPFSSPVVSYYLGLCCTQLEQYEDALIHLEHVVASDNDLLHIYQSRMILSYIYAVTKRHKLAEMELHALLEGGFESAQIHALYGYAAYAGGKIDDAIRHLSRALELDGNNVNALNSLGYILAQDNRDLDRALTLCRRAVQMQPENPAYLDSLGWAYYRLGNYSEARAHLRKALNLSGGNREIALHMKFAMKPS